MSDRQPWSLVAGGILAGAAAGLVVALLHAPGYRGTTTLVVTVRGVPAVDANHVVPTIAALATSDVVVQNLAQVAHVPAATVRRRLHSSVPSGTALLRITYDAPSGVEAARIAQQAATVVTSLAAARFGSVTVAGIDPARATRRQRAVAGALLLGAAIGAVFGLAGLRFGRRGLAAAGGVAALRAEPVSDTGSPAPAPGSPAPPPVSRAPAPSLPAPSPLARYRAALAAHGAAFGPDQVAEWEGYLAALEPHVADGELPPSLAGVAKDVFAPLLAAPGGTPGDGSTMSAS